MMDVDEADQLLQKPLEPRDYNRLAQWLRVTSEQTRMQFFQKHLHSCHSAFWRLATSCINSRSGALDLFKRGLDGILSPNSTMTRICTRFGVAKLGAKRAIAEIESRIDTQPHVVDMALYWLPSMIAIDDPSFALLKALQVKAEDKNIIKPVRRMQSEDGRITFADRYGNE